MCVLVAAALVHVLLWCYAVLAANQSPHEALLEPPVHAHQHRGNPTLPAKCTRWSSGAVFGGWILGSLVDERGQLTPTPEKSAFYVVVGDQERCKAHWVCGKWDWCGSPMEMYTSFPPSPLWTNLTLTRTREECCHSGKTIQSIGITVKRLCELYRLSLLPWHGRTWPEYDEYIMKFKESKRFVRKTENPI